MLGTLADELADGCRVGLLHCLEQQHVRAALRGGLGRREKIGAVEVDRIDLVELDEAGDRDRPRVVRGREGFEVGVLDDDELPFRHLPALDDLVVRDLAVVLRAPALVLDRRPALPMEHPERHVRLPRSRLGGQGHPDGDVDQAEAD